ncbi:MAG: hypothetical protein EOM59_04975 [Clostridia bacterium]|nr:hypothetical protein [Clostridia bacterium]
MENGKIKVGIGFATGRKHFQRILRSYVYNWKESGLLDDKDISINLFVAYDLKYKDTKKSDYTAMNSDINNLIDEKFFIGKREIDAAKSFLSENGIANEEDSSLVFGRGYAAQRNIILYYAIKNKIDYLLFLDDDEYPMAATKNTDTVIWSGQHVLKTHLASIGEADITHGYHCGYISPIPSIEFNDKMQEDDFRVFIKAISNDIVTWEKIKQVMNDGGVSYANTMILTTQETLEAQEHNKAKFISGSNLCFNLKDATRIYPFYNPPGARGEDTFLSTCLSERKVIRIPCYAFHDGFAAYNQLLSGTLPTSLKAIKADSETIVKRFYTACIGWVRYKPLLLYITDKDTYREKINEMKDGLAQTIPKICDYFGTPSFQNVAKELNKYDKNVEAHYKSFLETQNVWNKIMHSLKN